MKKLRSHCVCTILLLSFLALVSLHTGKKNSSINCQLSKSYSDSIDESENAKISKVKIGCFSSLSAIIYPVVLCFVLAVSAGEVGVECLFFSFDCAIFHVQNLTGKH